MDPVNTPSSSRGQSQVATEEGESHITKHWLRPMPPVRGATSFQIQLAGIAQLCTSLSIPLKNFDC